MFVRTHWQRAAGVGLFLVLVWGLGCLSLRFARAADLYPEQHVAIPAYFTPTSGDYWARLSAAAPAVGLAVMNPASGPGPAYDPAYAEVVRHARLRGVRVLGYVPTGYAGRALSEVEDDIATYFAWYDLDGIFLDEASSSCAHISYYRTLLAFVKAQKPRATVVLNPGAVDDQYPCYMDLDETSIVIPFEGPYADYASWQPPAWVATYPRERFWHLVYDTPFAHLADAVVHARETFAGWLYVTPDVLPNPWDTLPPKAYWETEVNHLTFPRVMQHDVQPRYVGRGPRRLTLAFSEALNPATAEDPANYLLVEAGPNRQYDTLSCAQGRAGDDRFVSVVSVPYREAPPQVTVVLERPLPPGRYRLFVCGTTSVRDTVGNPLNRGLRDAVLSFTVQRAVLPAAGFPPRRRMPLPSQSAQAHDKGTDLVLEIPRLGVQAPIVGVPLTEQGWDVTWLGRTVGWLEGSAFPTWPGNTVLTGHVWSADGSPGIFAHLKQLRYGEQIYLDAFGQRYVYAVRENRWVWRWQGAEIVFEHRDRDWLTLLTCEDYDPGQDVYLRRRFVRAVLVGVQEIEDAEPQRSR